jgi:peptide-methionine (S)-S-oxide reductase
LDSEQEEVARAYIAQLDQARVFKKTIATKVETGKTFFEAEGYHQDFLQRHPGYPYIVINDLPKLAELKKTFPDLYRESPVLVGTR